MALPFSTFHRRRDGAKRRRRIRREMSFTSLMPIPKRFHLLYRESGTDIQPDKQFWCLLSVLAHWQDFAGTLLGNYRQILPGIVGTAEHMLQLLSRGCWQTTARSQSRQDFKSTSTPTPFSHPLFSSLLFKAGWFTCYSNLHLAWHHSWAIYRRQSHLVLPLSFLPFFMFPSDTKRCWVPMSWDQLGA